jgi:hypothetical protein
MGKSCHKMQKNEINIKILNGNCKIKGMWPAASVFSF